MIAGYQKNKSRAFQSRKNASDTEKKGGETKDDLNVFKRSTQKKTSKIIMLLLDFFFVCLSKHANGVLKDGGS